MESPGSPESYESLSRRNAAAEILRSYEKLSWWSQQRCESLTQTRIHFRNIIARFTPADEEACVDWKTDYSRHPPKVGQEHSKRKSRGKHTAGSAPPVGGGEKMDAAPLSEDMQVDEDKDLAETSEPSAQSG